MGSLLDQFSLSLRAWPSKNDQVVPLASLIERINSERGSFREVTEEDLTEEAQRDEAGAESSKDDSASQVEDVEEEPDRAKELNKARGEILGQLEQAHNVAMVSLDFVSLLLSKDMPLQASLSISPALREAVALGTLSADVVQESRVTKSQKQDNKRIAKSWKLQSLTEAVDSILASATRLEEEIQKETKYWEQVLTVSENGWAICRLPQERHTLGVRFGFAESASTFNNRSLGALRRNIDGSIYLDQGIADPTPKRVRIRIQTNGTTTGEITPFESNRDPTSIVSSILLARNTIFEEELWHELNREARTLANQNVRVIGDEIVCGITGDKSIILDLQTTEDSELQSKPEIINHDNATAELISLSLHLLLSNAHRQNHHRRSQPPQPISDRPHPNNAYNLLRPILARLHHEAVMCSLINLLAPLSSALISAGVCNSAYTITTTPFTPSSQSKAQLAKAPQLLVERIVSVLVHNLSAEFTIPIIQSPFPPQVLTIRLSTTLSPLETRFHIALTGSLAKSCKPPPNPSTVGEVKGYVLWATSCALAEAFVDPHEQLKSDMAEVSQVHMGTSDNKADQEKQSSGIRGWHPTHNPTLLRRSFVNEMDSKQLSFEVIAVPRKQHMVEIRVTHKYIACGIERDIPHLGGHGNRVLSHVWKGYGLENDADRQQNGGGEEDVGLSQFVQDVGRWNTSSKGGKDDLGDGYEGAEWDWV